MISTAKKKLQLAVILIFIAALGMSLTLLVQAQNPTSTTSPVADWRPNHAANGWRFVGSKVCAECHTSKVKTQTTTPMSRALFTPEKADILRDHPKLTYRNGQYNYLLTRDGNRTMYTISDGLNTLTVPISYAFDD